MAVHPLIKLRPKEGRRLRGGAPWAFSNEIVMDAAAKSLAPGSIVNVQGDDGIVFGTGYFNAASLISIRMLDPKADAKIDAGFFAIALKRALMRREAVYDAPYYRLVHAEGDALPGLAIDRFADLCSIQVTTAGMEKLTPALLEALNEVIAPKTVMLRNDAPSRALEGLGSYVRSVKGEVPERITVLENGVRYFADIGGGQKAGWYFDQRENHAFMAKLATNRSVLDAYCYAGGFGLAAAKNGAKSVTGIDSSQGALILAEEAAAANGVKAKFVKADVFEDLERLAVQNGKFDVVIADPPPFVKSRKDIEPGAKAYRKLARLAATVTAPNGFLLLASCSHNIAADRFALECAIGIARAGRRAALIHQAGAGADHPVHPMLPETAYLKALVYALD
ncbi:MAG: class I SAM-dependent rRNA methyltransferase [Proteobacteria bacterium]|nr:class I SAM-dependent rRNA methyltransferase [Pseudomonadota bacterium]